MADLTGRSQFVRNVIVGGGMHFVVVIAGFLVPRQISDGLGQNALGIWDLGWATLQYVAVGSLGIEGALTRWVSLHRAGGTIEELPSHTTTAFIWQLIVAMIALLLFSVFALTMHSFIELGSAEEYEQAKYVLLLMGGALSVRLLGSIPGSVLAGCHRFDIQHSIEGFQDFTLALLLVSMVLAGADLVQLAVLVLCVELLGAGLRIYYARKICPEAKVVLKERDFGVGKKLLSFGVKNLIVNAPQVIIIQTVAILLASFASPAVLSVFNRGMALLKFMEKLVRKISNQFMSMASGYIGAGKEDEVNKLIVEAGRFSFAVTLPMALGLIFFGDFLLELWMGKAYADETMMIALVIGAIIPISNIGVVSVATGLNLHGALAKIGLIGTVISLAVALPVVTYVGWETVSAAIAVGVSWSVGRGLSVAYLIKYKLEIGIMRYFLKVWLLPLGCNLPLAVGFYLGDLMLQEQNIILFLSACSIGGLITLMLYWVYLLPEAFKTQITGKLLRR